MHERILSMSSEKSKSEESDDQFDENDFCETAQVTDDSQQSIELASQKI